MDLLYREVLEQLVKENCITKIANDQVKTIKRIGKGSQSQNYNLHKSILNTALQIIDDKIKNNDCYDVVIFAVPII
jgi:hypothetical protein